MKALIDTGSDHTLSFTMQVSLFTLPNVQPGAGGRSG